MEFKSLRWMEYFNKIVFILLQKKYWFTNFKIPIVKQTFVFFTYTSILILLNYEAEILYLLILLANLHLVVSILEDLFFLLIDKKNSP